MVNSSIEELRKKVMERFRDDRVICLLNAQYFYHGTQERKLERIKAEGLKPSSEHHDANYEISNSHSVYITSDKESAKRWAMWNARPYEKWVILAIPRDVVIENFDNLHEDENLIYYEDSWRLEDVEIKPEQFSIVETGERT